MTDAVVQPNKKGLDLLLAALLAARGGAAPWFNLKTITLLSDLCDGTEELDAKSWLNLTNMVTMSPAWGEKIALWGWRMPTPAEAFEQIRILS